MPRPSPATTDAAGVRKPQLHAQHVALEPGRDLGAHGVAQAGHDGEAQAAPLPLRAASAR